MSASLVLVFLLLEKTLTSYSFFGFSLAFFITIEGKELQLFVVFYLSFIYVSGFWLDCICFVWQKCNCSLIEKKIHTLVSYTWFKQVFSVQKLSTQLICTMHGFIQAILMSLRQHKKTQSSNWVFKFDLHKIFFWIILALKLCLKYIYLLGFLFNKPFIGPPDLKRPKSFIGLTPWTPTKVLLGIHCKDYSTLTPWPAFYNTEKLNLSSKMDISKTAWINPCHVIY